MFVSSLFLPLLFHERFFAAILPASGAITNSIPSISNANATADSIGYPPGYQEQLIQTCGHFYPSPPNPLLLYYRNRDAPATRNDIPIPLIGDCVDEGVLKVEVLITAFGKDSRIRPEEMDGDFQCEAAGQRLNINFYPQAQEPTYQDVEWGLLAIKEASLNRTVNFHEEATIFAKNLRIRPQGRPLPVSRMKMFLSDVQTESLAATQ